MDQQRIMEVWRSGAGAGSGCLIADRLVLTAYHVVPHTDGPPAGQVQVRRLDQAGGSVWVSARLIWPEHAPDLDTDPGADAALLLITGPSWQPPASTLVRFGRIDSDGRERIPCLAVGFPEAEHRDGVRDTKEIRGHVEPLTGIKSGLISVHVDHSAAPTVPSTRSRWAGSSGAALFCGPLLVGVIATDRARDYQADQHTAVAVATLSARHPDFLHTLHSRGLAVEFEEARAPAAGGGHGVRPPHEVTAPPGAGPVVVDRLTARSRGAGLVCHLAPAGAAVAQDQRDHDAVRRPPAAVAARSPAHPAAPFAPPGWSGLRATAP